MRQRNFIQVLFSECFHYGNNCHSFGFVIESVSNGLGNDSDQVGRNIMDHHKGAGAEATVEGFDDQYYSGRRPNGIYVPRFRNLKEKGMITSVDLVIRVEHRARGWRSDLYTDAIGDELKRKHRRQARGQWG